MKKYTLLPLVLVFLCIYTGEVISQTDATLALPDTIISSGGTVTIPIFVSTNESIGLAQFTIEYNSAIIEFKEAAIGNGASGFSISMLNPTLPFSPSTANTDENVLIQISGSGAGSFTGEHKQVLTLKFDVKTVGTSPLAFDQVVNRTFLTTTGLTDIYGSNITFDDGSVEVTTTSVKSNENLITPMNYNLAQNYPNPFNPETTIRFNVKESNHVSLKVYDILGQEVATLVDNNFASGSYSTKFNAHQLSSGTYFYKIEIGDFSAVRKMIISK